MNGIRRGRFEVLLDILLSCSEGKGIPPTALHYEQALTYTTLKEVLQQLMEVGLIEVNIHDQSWDGHKRQTSYYKATEKASPIVEAWRLIKKSAYKVLM